MLFSVTMTLLPIVIIVVLMTWKGWAADTSGVTGWFLTVVIACLFFQTSLEVALRASLAGIVASFPVSLMGGYVDPPNILHGGHGGAEAGCRVRENSRPRR